MWQEIDLAPIIQIHLDTTPDHRPGFKSHKNSKQRASVYNLITTCTVSCFSVKSLEFL